MNKPRLQELPLRQTRHVYGPDGLPLLAVPPRKGEDTPPRISIVTPSYNQGDFLEECILSVLEQGYPNLEYIIMDGGSTDRSVEIIKKYEKYLTYWQSQRDGGQYQAINEGFRRSTGSIMAWINSDDKYHPGSFRTVADAFISHPEVSWLTGRPSTWNEQGDLADVRMMRTFTRDDYLDPALDTYIQQESTFWRRDLWEKSGGAINDEFDYAGDFELWLRFFDHAQLHLVDALLAGFRYHAAQKTAVASERYLEEVQRIRRTQHVASNKGTSPPTHRIEIATSLVPNNVSGQLPAVRSWQKLGFEVVSINPAEEIPLLDQHYPGVRFISAKRHGKHLVGKPCVFIDDILSYFRTSAADRFGIVNSDVFLFADRDFVDFIGQHSRNALVYGSRVEIPGYGSALGYTYHYGFDYFFFDRILLDAYPASQFMLGIPWWDYWVPFQAVQAGVPIKRLDAYVAFHVSHPVNYRQDDLYRFKEHLLSLAKSPLLNEAIRRVEVRVGDPDEALQRETQLALLGDVLRHSLECSDVRLEYSSPVVELNAINQGAEPDRPYRVSAIVSTYASATFIADCLDDLLSQSIADDTEIIVIDAASPENEAEIVRAYQAKHANIRYHRTAERIGVYAAWNLAIRMAQGAYLVSCSTNDRLRPNALELMARVLDEQPEIALTYGFSYLTRTPHESFARFSYAGCYKWADYSYRGLLKEPSIGPHPMWRRRLHDEFGWFDERYTAISDQDFWLRVGARYPMRCLWDFTGLYLVSDDSLSGNRARAQSEYRQIAECHRREYAYGLWREGRYFTTGMARRIDAELDGWIEKPQFTLFLRHTQADFHALSATIRSLTAQLYGAFRLVVLSPIQAPPGIEGERLAWIQCPPSQWAEAVNQLAAGVDERHATWVAVLADGDRLPERALLTLALDIHSHTAWQLLYVDEDEIDAEGKHHSPHFKPAFDPDHVLATPYIGEVLFFRADHLADLGGLCSALPEAETFDLMLRTLESCSPEAIGHVPDVLLHRPAGRWSPYPQHSHAQAVADHLGRKGIDASIRFDEGQPLRLDFQVPAAKAIPSVAIVIYPATCQLAALEQAITSLLEKTPPQPHTLYLINPGPRHPDIWRFLTQLESLGLPNVVFLPAPYDEGLVRILQEAVARITDDFLVFWADDSVAVQTDWLTPLLKQFSRPSSPVAVGPRLANAAAQLISAGEIMGLCGPSGAPYKGVFLDYPGENAWLQSDHRARILDRRCLLVRRSTLAAAGGLDTASSEEHWAAELCLRLGTLGPLLWTPSSTVMVRESLEQLEQEDTSRRKSELGGATIATLLRWQTQIANQVAAEPHLNMEARDLIPETRSALTYAPLASLGLPRIYAHAADREGCGHYRVLQPLEALLSNARVSGGAATDPLPLARMVADEFDTLIFQRPHTAPVLRAMHQYRQLSSALRIFEVDDLLTDVPESSPHARDFGPDTIALFKQALGLCNRLVVPTEALAQAYGQLVDEVRVVPNYLPKRVWNTLTPARRSGNRPRVGWAGSISHLGDLALLTDVVKTLANEVDWVFLGTCSRDMLPYISEKKAAVSFSQYPAALASMGLDLAIAPIASNAFNEAKSNLKLLEYGILGYPVVCSDIGPYRQGLPVKRVTNTPQAWIAAIRERIHDTDAARQEGIALRAQVRQHWMLDDHLDEWLAAWTR
ncbi:MAG TPA: glycosyltransferase [Thauera sp.]|uniref:glycosyltransferase n=1 Tax=Thauera sp. WB-2 TaxID=2897772 RepID=UPI0022DCF3DC|nr:glycosyltransferase [Thauera sp. WB-2]WBL65836.1 glycosyltransferase [Thauera sp. WB-2]HRJ23412.1 glycosyltransferase [Thauera sp.]